MESIALASDSLQVLNTLMGVGFALMSVMLAIASGTMLAWKMLPFSPSDEMSEPSEFHSTAAQARYALTQLRLIEIHAARKALLAGDDSVMTRSVLRDLDLATQIDPVRTMMVC
jgi:hypothetical protein